MRLLLTLLLICQIASVSAQKKAYGDGEWFKFRIHYGFVTAGYATIEVEEKNLNGTPVYHVQGEGHTTGMTDWVFSVEDYYQSYIDKTNDRPLRFIRKINEGGHTKDIQIDFDHNSQKATINNKKHKEIKVEDFPRDAQDMVSAFYYLRNHLDVSTIKKGESVMMDMFFDRENYKFKLKFLGRETIKTKFGKVPCMIFRPYVQSGRVFKEKESLTVWVSDDDNKMPILIKGELMVGSIKASLSEFKGLQHSFTTIAD